MRRSDDGRASGLRGPIGNLSGAIIPFGFAEHSLFWRPAHFLVVAQLIVMTRVWPVGGELAGTAIMPH
jgi:hypothetical protein